MNLAVLSVSALALAVLVSCVSRVNVGVLALALAWIVGVLIGGQSVNTVMGGFPGQLFLTLTGVTLLFTLAHCNGTLERLTHHAVRACQGSRGAVPVMFFAIGAVLSSIGPGNIATAALVIPLAMATAARMGIPLFLMAIMAGNGANAGALSPFAPTGIIVNGLMARNGLPGFQVETYAYNFLAHAGVAFAGYALFGGLRLFGTGRTGVQAADVPVERFELRHWITLGVIAALIASVVVAKANVGMAAFVCSAILVLTGMADDGEAIRQMPWRVIMMVCGVTVLIALAERAQGLELVTALIARISTETTVTGVVALITGVVSVYSSTSGVVLPAFLPLVPGLAAHLPAASPFAIAMSMNIGGHLVDVSPLSTIGALCMTGTSGDDSRALFNKLLAWGLSMSVVGAVLCYFLF
jgi:di/tricarboxylate transporter